MTGQQCFRSHQVNNAFDPSQVNNALAGHTFFLFESLKKGIYTCLRPVPYYKHIGLILLFSALVETSV
jgi:hypothetical protein